MQEQSQHTLQVTSLLVLICTLSSPDSAEAQQLLFHYSDPAPYRFGYSVAVMEDLDGDGVPEIGIGSWGDGPYIISGQTGTVLYHSTAPSGVDAYGVSVDGLPDITGDGIAEYVVGSREVSGSTPLHEVRSGADGSLVRAHDFAGFEITEHDDLDGDGWADYVLVNERVMQIRSGISGAVLGEWAIPIGQGDRLNRVARTGDVNGDGVPDVVGGQIDWSGGGGMGPGRVHMFSGADGSLLWTVTGDDVPDFFGMDVTGDIDVNADGIPDVVALSAPWSHPVDYVRVLSGQDGSVLRSEFLPPALTTIFYRYAVVTLPDLNGDGIAEYAIGGATASCSGVVELRSGASGMPLLQLTGSPGFGTSMDGSRDWDGDGLVDLAVGACDCDDYGGEVFIYSFANLLNMPCFRLKQLMLNKRFQAILARGTFDAGPDFDPTAEEITFEVTDTASGQTFAHHVPAGGFQLLGGHASQIYAYETPDGVLPDFRAMINLKKCTFRLDRSRGVGLMGLEGPDILFRMVTTGSGVGEELVTTTQQGPMWLTYLPGNVPGCCD